MKSCSFQQAVKTFAEVTGTQVFKILFATKAQFYKIIQLRKKDILFANYPESLYANDVILQQANRPSGRIEEGKVHFSGKHHLYGYKLSFQYSQMALLLVVPILVLKVMLTLTYLKKIWHGI